MILAASLELFFSGEKINIINDTIITLECFDEQLLEKKFVATVGLNSVIRINGLVGGYQVDFEGRDDGVAVIILKNLPCIKTIRSKAKGN